MFNKLIFSFINIPFTVKINEFRFSKCHENYNPSKIVMSLIVKTIKTEKKANNFKYIYTHTHNYYSF